MSEYPEHDRMRAVQEEANAIAGPMKALTVKQPWASLIMSGEKDVENRSWATRHRGLIAIHSSARPDRDAIRRGLGTPRDPLEADCVECGDLRPIGYAQAYNLAVAARRLSSGVREPVDDACAGEKVARRRAEAEESEAVGLTPRFVEPD